MSGFGAGIRSGLFGSIVASLMLLPASASLAAQSRFTGETRVYILRGFGDELTSSAVDEVGYLIRMRDPRVSVRVENWHDWEDILPDAASRPGARIVLVGFSMGARSAGLAANELARRGIDVKVVGLDPMCADAAVDQSPHIQAVSFYRSTCGDGGQMRGARNVRVGDRKPLGIFTLIGHTGFPANPVVQQLVVREVFWDEYSGRPRLHR